MTPVELTSVRGRLVPSAEVEFPKGAIGWLRGFGVYETLFHYPNGCFRVDAHLQRLRESVGLLRIPMPDPDEVKAALAAWERATEVAWAHVRIVVLEGDGEPWWMIEGQRLEGPRPAVAARALSMWMAPFGIPPPPLGAAKTISRVGYELAALEAHDRGADDALMPTSSGELGESTRASVFWREGDRLYTPPLSLGILPGVTRSLLRDHLPDAGWPVEERTVPWRHLWEVDEVFVSSTVRGVAPVIRLLADDLEPRDLPVGEAVRAADSVVMDQVRAEGLL